MKILAIETSCDETSAAVVEKDKSSSQVIVHSSVLATSIAKHALTGGIIPEQAAREQIKYIMPVIIEALQKSIKAINKQDIKFTRPQEILEHTIDAIAVTVGPGLIGPLLVGVETAKTLSFTTRKPIIPVNHLLGHLYANFIQPSTLNLELSTLNFPAVGLIVSGGHTDLLLFENETTYKWLGGTRDDAAGECFDKCARLLGYNYPGGPKIANLAEYGNPEAFQFPRPMFDSNNFEFSFSGLKTSFLNTTKKNFPILRTNIPNTKDGWQQVVHENNLSSRKKQILYDLCASLQAAIVDVLVEKTFSAASKFGAKSILISGGVAANQKLREKLELRAKSHQAEVNISAPEKKYCMDNAAMIGAAACFISRKKNWRDIEANPELYFNE